MVTYLGLTPDLTSRTWVNVPEPESCSKDFTCKTQAYIQLAPKSLLERSHIHLLMSNLEAAYLL